MNTNDDDETIKAFQNFNNALDVLNRGPLEYTVKCLVAAHKTLLTRYAPFKVGDRIALAVTPVINKTTAYGWLGSKHFLKVGAVGVVKSSEVRSNGELAFYIEFDDETWIDRDGVARPMDEKSTYCFGEKDLALLPA